MRLLLTSMGIGGIRENGVKVDAYINDKNAFVDVIKDNILATDTFVFIASDKMDWEHNDISCRLNVKALEKIGITFKNVVVLDYRNKDSVEDILSSADMVFLQGGDVVQQNRFLVELDIKNVLKNTGCIDRALIVGQSAGSMNLADIVYVYPDADAMEVDYPKYVLGLGYTPARIIPHFNIDTGNNFGIPGIDLINNYFIPDSHNVSTIAILDGTYISVFDKNTTIHGEAYLVKNGNIIKINDDNKIKILDKKDMECTYKI